MYCWRLKELCTKLVFWKVYILARLFSNYQLNAHFLYFITIYMLHCNPQHVSSRTLLIFRRTVCRLRVHWVSSLSTRILYGCLQRVPIPEAVIIQFVLLKMSKVRLETCWGLQCNIYRVSRGECAILREIVP